MTKEFKEAVYEYTAEVQLEAIDQWEGVVYKEFQKDSMPRQGHGANKSVISE